MLLKFTTFGQRIAINANNIVSIAEQEDGTTIISDDQRGTFHVEESYDAVMEKMQKAEALRELQHLVRGSIRRD